MSLIFKHLLRSIRRRPAQPVIIALVITLSVVMAVCCLRLINCARAELMYSKAARTGNADISIVLGGSSPARFITAGELRSAVGEGGAVAGYYTLPLYDVATDDFIWGAATDFEDISGVFGFDFVEYGKLEYGTLNTSAFVSRSFAEQNGLGIGSRFSVRLIGSVKSYTVQGINSFPFFGQYDVIVNVEGAIGALAAQSPIFAAFGGDYMPYSALFARLADPSQAQSVADGLRSAGAYAGQNISICSASDESYIDTLLLVILWTMSALSVVVSGAFIYSCLREIARIREEENYSLVLAGTPPRLMRALVVAEMLLYVVVGGVLGTAISAGLLSLLSHAIDFVYAAVSITSADVLFGGLFALAVGVAGVFSYLLFPSSGKKTGRHAAIALSAIGFLLLCGGFVSFIWSGGMYYLVGTFMAAAGLIMLLLYGLPLALHAVTGAAMRRFSSSRNVRHPCAALAVNNVHAVAGIRNFVRLAALIIAIIVVIFACISFGNSQLSALNNLFSGDYVVVNQSAALSKKIAHMPQTASCAGLYVNGDAMLFGNKRITLISMQSEEVLSAEYRPEELPHGDELILPRAIAVANGLDIGDEVSVIVDNKQYPLHISAYTDAVDYVVMFDCKYFGMEYNYLVVTAAEGISPQDYRADLISSLAADAPLVIQPSQLTRQQNILGNVFMAELWLFFGCNLTVSAIGLVNMLCITYNRRKDEFALCRTIGLSRRELAFTIFSELAIAICATLLAAAAGGALGCLCMDFGMRAFGFTLL